MNRSARWGLLICSFLTYLPVYAAPASTSRDKGGSGLARALNGGIVYPSLYGSIEGHPAGLIHDNKTVIQIEWDPPSSTAPSGSLTQGFAFGNGVFGLGASLATSVQGNLLAMNRSTLAAALGATGFAIGANASFDIARGTGADFDLGISVENMSGIQLSVLMTAIQSFRSTGALNFGIGIAKPRKYQIEGSWSYTLFSPLQQHILRVSAIGYLGIFGLGINGSSTSNINASSFGVGLAGVINATQRIIIGLRSSFDSLLGPNHTVSGTLAF